MSSRRVNFEQLEILWEFLNARKDLAMGYNKSVEAREMSRRMWNEVGELLNTVAGGTIKEPKGWAAYWVDYKGKLKRKCAAIRTQQGCTGAGKENISLLTDIERKYLSILGEDDGARLSSVQVDPFHRDRHTHGLSTPAVTLVSSEEDESAQLSPTIANRTPQRTSSTMRAVPVEARYANLTKRSSKLSYSDVIQQHIGRRHHTLPMKQDSARRAMVDSGHASVGTLKDIAMAIGRLERVACRIADSLEKIHDTFITEVSKL